MTYAQSVRQVAAELDSIAPNAAARLRRLAVGIHRTERAWDEVVADAAEDEMRQFDLSGGLRS